MTGAIQLELYSSFVLLSDMDTPAANNAIILNVNSCQGVRCLKVYEFDAEIKKQETTDATYVEFPYDVEAEFGVRGQVKVLAAFDGCEYRGSLAKMGHNCHILGMTQKIRASIGKKPGDIVHVVLRKDDEPRIVEVPEDFGRLLGDNMQAASFYNTLSYTNQKSYTDWITAAKKAETREKRLKESISMLLNKTKHP